MRSTPHFPVYTMYQYTCLCFTETLQEFKWEQDIFSFCNKSYLKEMITWAGLPGFASAYWDTSVS